MPKTFLYFAYGSNLLSQRMHERIPSAVRRGAGKLNDYRIDFNRFSTRWGGCSATIVQDAGKHVWGAIWEVNEAEMPDLDRQEGVNNNVYKPLDVEVISSDSKPLQCRVYQLLDEPDTYSTPSELPNERRPSRVYLETILQGAVESKLPDYYVQFLSSFPHNGFTGPVDVSGLNIEFTLTRKSK